MRLENFNLPKLKILILLPFLAVWLFISILSANPLTSNKVLYQSKGNIKSLLFEEPDVKTKFVSRVEPGDTLTVLERRQEWVKVENSKGLSGWLHFKRPSSDDNPSERIFDLVNIGTKAKAATADSDKNANPANSKGSLEERIAALERKVQELETIISKLEVGTSGTSLNTTPNKPSDSEIEKAIKALLNYQVPVSWVGNLLGGKNANVYMVQVLETGNFNVGKKYWPMRVKCRGSCELNDPFNQGARAEFDEVGEFLLFQDDYGKWQANIKGGMFQ